MAFKTNTITLNTYNVMGNKKELKFQRPTRIRVFFVDAFTKNERMVFDTPYNCLDMLKGYPRKQILKLKELYRKEKILYSHSPKEFHQASNLKTRLEFLKL